MPGRRVNSFHSPSFPHSPSVPPVGSGTTSPAPPARWTRALPAGDAAGGAVPAGFAGRERVRVEVDGRGGDPGPGRVRDDGHHHGRHVGDRRRDGARAGEARRARGGPGAQRQGRRGRARAHRGRVPRRRRPRAPARPQLARVRARLRRPVPRARPAAPPPHKQCRQVLARAAGALGGRRGDDLRHKLPRALPADQAAGGADGGDGGGHGRAGPHRQRVVQRARLVRRRLGRVPAPRHAPKDTLRRDAGVRRVQARQRAAHQRARRAPAGNGRQRDGELRAPGHRQDPPQPRPRRRAHRSGVPAAVQAAENDPSGCGDHVLRGGPPEGGRRVRPLLRRLQRGAAVAGRHRPPRGRAPLAGLRGHHRRLLQHRPTPAGLHYCIATTIPPCSVTNRSFIVAASSSLLIQFSSISPSFRFVFAAAASPCEMRVQYLYISHRPSCIINTACSILLPYIL